MGMGEGTNVDTRPTGKRTMRRFVLAALTGTALLGLTSVWIVLEAIRQPTYFASAHFHNSQPTSLAFLPGIWIVLSSLRPTVEILAKPPVWIPQQVSLDAYVAMFSGVGKGGIPVLDYFRNSLIISVTSTVIAVAIGMAGGYAFARYRFRGKSAMFLGLGLLATGIVILMFVLATVLGIAANPGPFMQRQLGGNTQGRAPTPEELRPSVEAAFADESYRPGSVASLRIFNRASGVRMQLFRISARRGERPRRGAPEETARAPAAREAAVGLRAARPEVQARGHPQASRGAAGEKARREEVVPYQVTKYVIIVATSFAAWMSAFGVPGFPRRAHEVADARGLPQLLQPLSRCRLAILLGHDAGDDPPTHGDLDRFAGADARQVSPDVLPQLGDFPLCH